MWYAHRFTPVSVKFHKPFVAPEWHSSPCSLYESPGLVILWHITQSSANRLIDDSYCAGSVCFDSLEQVPHFLHSLGSWNDGCQVGEHPIISSYSIIALNQLLSLKFSLNVRFELTLELSSDLYSSLHYCAVRKGICTDGVQKVRDQTPSQASAKGWSEINCMLCVRTQLDEKDFLYVLSCIYSVWMLIYKSNPLQEKIKLHLILVKCNN